MPATLVSLVAAQAARTKFRKRYAHLLPEMNGLGVAISRGRYIVKVNLRTATKQDLPKKIDGVPVVVEVVGPIRAL